MDNIIYQINEYGERISDENWNGYFERTNDDSLWVHIYDQSGTPVNLSAGDKIHFSHYDQEIDRNYEIIKPCNGIYQVKPYCTINSL